MANIQSNKKRHIQDQKKRALTHSKKAEARTLIKKTKNSKKPEDFVVMTSVLDKAAKTGRFHQNKVNRIKSRVAAIINNN